MTASARRSREGRPVVVNRYALFSVRALRTTVLVQGLILCLLFLDSAVVVHKDKGTLVLRITVALCSLVAGAQVTGWIVSWQSGSRRGFLLPSAYLQFTHDAGSIETYCQGLFVRCGDTRSQLPRRALYRRCDITFRRASGIVKSSKCSLTSEQ